MKKKHTKQKKMLRLTLWIFALSFILLTLFSSELFGSDSIFNGVFKGEQRGVEIIWSFLKTIIPLIAKLIIYIIIILLLSKLLKIIIAKLFIVSKSGKTASYLIESFIKYVAAIAMFIAVLLVFGVNATALFASVGVLGVVIGLGAQSLISDIISGLFIVFEKDYEIGDYIVIDEFRGQVESIGIRTTKLKDSGGNVKIINNSEIKTVINLSSEPSAAEVDISVKYEDFQRAEKLLTEKMDLVKSQLPKYIEGPKYLGPTDLTKEAIILKFFGNVDESYRFQAERDLRKIIRNLFDENNILNPYPKIVCEVEKTVDPQDII